MTLLNDEERQALLDLLKAQRLDRMFGDGQEEGYVMDGFPNDKGLSAMSDIELLTELGHHGAGDSPEEMARLWRIEAWTCGPRRSER